MVRSVLVWRSISSLPFSIDLNSQVSTDEATDMPKCAKPKNWRVSTAGQLWASRNRTVFGRAAVS